MKNNRLEWETTDGIKIVGKYWPVKAPKAVLHIVHGMGEHIQRYEQMAEFYNRAGIAVIGNDHRGHGLSGGKRGHIPEYSVLLDEVSDLLAKGEELFPGSPRFLFGQSLGGNLVLNYVLRRKPNISGVIASSPWIQLAYNPGALKVMAGKLMKNLYPTFTQATKLNPMHLSTDEEVGHLYMADPLTHDKITAAMGTEMLDAGNYLDNYTGKFPLPLLLLQGSGDQITSFEATQRFAKRVSGPVTFIPWEGLYHELHNEIRREEVLNSSLEWIELQLDR